MLTGLTWTSSTGSIPQMPWPAPDAEKLTWALQSEKEAASGPGSLDESTGCKLQIRNQHERENRGRPHDLQPGMEAVTAQLAESLAEQQTSAQSLVPT